MTTVPEISLAHVGVKGMKWGVRKAEGASTESRSLRRQSSLNMMRVSADRTAEDLLYTGMRKADYDKLSTGREFIAKGSSLKRVAMSPDNTLTGRTFVSQLPADSTFYRAAIPAFGANVKKPGAGQKRYKDDFFELDIKTTKRLSSPSEKERVDTFIEVLNERSIVGKKGPLTGREYMVATKQAPMFSKNYDTQKFGLETYNDFVKGQGHMDNPLNDAYFKKIREKGFNAIPDENDRNRFTKAPLILLDPDGTAKVQKVQKLTADDINQAQRELARGKI